MIDRKSYETNETDVRKRARGVFALLEQTLAQIEADGQAVVNEDTVVDVLLDEPGHVRLSNNDDEIVARACYLQQVIALPRSRWSLVTTGCGLARCPGG
ncbi:hypothetical protein [Streptomyces sp. KR55]|uniref:hypothetical protein n=1 Tax=Streptomyces sp. KR55 TaxID=3457425 RepID=UPI003FD5B70A